MFNPFAKKEILKKEEAINSTTDVEEAKQEEEFDFDKNITVHSMPESYRIEKPVDHSSKKVGLLIMIFGLLFLLIASIVAYYFLFVKKPQAQTKVEIPIEEKKEETPIASTSPNTMPVIETFKESPREAFLRIKQAEAVTTTTITTSSPSINEFGDIIETINGETATLIVATKNNLATGTIIMSKEGDGWKIGSESWEFVLAANKNIATTSEVIASTTDIALSPAIDSDNDGLSDKEEALFGSNPDMANSDEDKYSDSAEFVGLYNPAGKGILAESDKIKKYEDKNLGISFLYPSAWEASMMKAGDTIMIKSQDNQFIQINVSPNDQKETIDEWYKRSFSVAEIAPIMLLASTFWDGVKSEDGLSIYLTEKNFKNIITITYNPAESQTADYLNVLSLVLKSFEVK